MIGGYAQLAYGFNYYGTVGSNRDEFLVVRKMKHVDWLDDESTPAPATASAGPEPAYEARQGEAR
jgi:nitrate reductase alpha subunit